MTVALLLPLATLAAAPAPAPAPQASVPGVQAPADESDGALFDRARALATGGRREEAIALYDVLLARSPGHADARLARGRTHAWMRQWDAAEADLLAVTAASPGYADAWSALGDMYLWSDRPQQAVDAYTRWSALRPGAPAPLIARSRAHRAAGALDAARADAEAAVALGADPADIPDLSAPSAARAAEPEASAPPGFTWQLRADLGYTDFSGSRSSWEDRSLALRRYFEQGSIAVEYLWADRFDAADHALALDAYVDLWPRAYANLRYQTAPDGVRFPDHSWRAELYQGVGRGWELSASIDHLQFDRRGVDIYGLGVGRYSGNVYARLRVRRASPSGSMSYQGLARYYYAGNGDEYLELSGGTGRSRDERLASVSVDDTSASLGVAWVNYFTPRVGLKLAAGYDDDTPSSAQASATVYYRW